MPSEIPLTLSTAAGTAATTPTPLLKPGAWPPGNSFVSVEHKLVYISVTKVACSSLRWMMADLAGEDFGRFYRAPGNHQSRLMTIHTARTTWANTPQIKNVPPDVLAEISRDNGWFIFAVVRDPWSRLWSAWQSKFLVRHGSFVAEYGDEPWFPRIPESADDVLVDWRAFVMARPWQSHPRLRHDPHFMPQVDSVHPDRVNYTKIYDLPAMSTLLDDLRAHLRRLGKETELYVPRANENPIRMTRDVLGGDIAEMIEDAYQRDFAEFGDRWRLADVRVSEGSISPDAVRAIEMHAAANQRIDDLSTELRSARKEIKRLRTRAATLAAAAKPKPKPTPVRRVLAQVPGLRPAVRAIRRAIRKVRRSHR